MPKVSFIKPLDQPLGTRRLLDDLRDSFSSANFSDFKMVVAYAKSGPLLRLESSIQQWNANGKSSSAILGIDQLGTSKEALSLSLGLFDQVYITQEPGITFHPKIYIFSGEQETRVFIGSNNLTVGGTEMNFESAVQLDLSAKDDSETIAHALQLFSDLTPANCAATFSLDPTALSSLENQKRVLPESQLYSNSAGGGSVTVGAQKNTVKSKLTVKPQSPLPKKSTPKPVTKGGVTPAVAATPAVPAAQHSIHAAGFAIQIKPHHNGEIFLSVSAALQNPGFFGWPFTGSTVPKKPGNPSYPQLSPDPVVNVSVIGLHAHQILLLPKYRLNTVYYSTKSEIRVTASPLVGVVPDYSVMIMEPSPRVGIDYEITIHTPDSPSYPAWVAACNQQMPGGGSVPRKYGWF